MGSHAQKQGLPGVCKVVAVLDVEDSSERYEFRVEGKSSRTSEASFALHARRSITFLAKPSKNH